MSTTETPLPTLYVRFLRSGLTYAGSVWRRGSVTTCEPGIPEYEVFARTEAEQRVRWPDGAYFEHLTAEQYEAIKNGKSTVVPEPAPPVAAAKLPPPPEEGTTRGLDHGTPSPGPTSHTPPAELTAPAATADPEGARWPWYAEADVNATLMQVANMGDSEAQAFLAYETTHKARKGVLGPMTGS